MAPDLSLVVDTDCASDDAIAILLAARTPGVTLRGITVVAGNVALPQAIRNVLVTLELAGVDVPVYAGLSTPLLREHVPAYEVHGRDGMSGARVREPTTRPESEHAVDVLRRLAAEEPGRHTLVTLGPLSNVATALLLDPDLLTAFRRTYLMAGAADNRGNVSPTAEYNVWCDPEAAAVVLAAPGPKTMIGWDVSRTCAVIGPAEADRLRSLGRYGTFAADITTAVRAYLLGLTGIDGFDLPDPAAMAVALWPDIVTAAEPRHLLVSTDASTRGQTYADHRRPPLPATATVVLAIDHAAFIARLFETLAGD